MKNQSTRFESGALPRFLRATFIAGLLPTLLLLLSIQSGRAGSAAWKTTPAGGDWNTAGNWTAGGPPNGSADTATFASSNVTSVSDSLNTEVNGIVFNAGASAFTIAVTTTPTLQPTFTISGAGITNNSGVVQNIMATGDPGNGVAFIAFTNSATAGSLTTYTFNDNGRADFFGTSTAGSATFSNSAGATGAGVTIFHDTSTAGNGVFSNDISLCCGGETAFVDSSTAGNSTITNAGNPNSYPGETVFLGTATAGNGTFTNNGSTANYPGLTIFYGSSTAGNGIFVNNGSPAIGGPGGNVQFLDSSTADNGVFTNNGATVSGANGGLTSVGGSASAGNGTFIANGGTVSGAGSGVALLGSSFVPPPNAGNATLIANAGQNGGAGGLIQLVYGLTGGTARIEVFGNGTGDSTNGTLDIGGLNSPGVTTGSIEGSGLVTLGANNLTIGANNLSTAFSGIISDGGNGGSLTKIGKGKLTFSNANTYTGGTTVSKGTLLVTNRSGSATGTGAVAVNAGTLGGTGKISGAFTIGTATSAAILAPGSGTRPGKLTLSKTLTCNARANYKVDLNSTLVTADQVAAKGVTINSGATVTVGDLGTGTLTAGTVFAIINNTAQTVIAGTFSNLADGSTLIVGSNTYKANYEGGTGNDLTLTVQ